MLQLLLPAGGGSPAGGGRGACSGGASSAPGGSGLAAATEVGAGGIGSNTHPSTHPNGVVSKEEEGYSCAYLFGLFFSIWPTIKVPRVGSNRPATSFSSNALIASCARARRPADSLPVASSSPSRRPFATRALATQPTYATTLSRSSAASLPMSGATSRRWTPRRASTQSLPRCSA